jgi:type IV pilus assembly protein PilN
MRVTLNLATRPFTDLGPAIKRLRIAMGALAVIALALLLGLHALHQKAEEARAREHSFDGEIARVTREHQGYVAMMQQPENARFMSQVEDLNQLFDEKAFSWTLAMENLETVLPAGVQVTQIEPIRAKTGQTTLHLHVVGPHDLAIDLVRNLEHSKRFLLPRIVGENAESTNSGPNARVEPVSTSNRFEFDLLADYNPPTPDERIADRHERKESTSDTDTGNRPGASHRVPGPVPGAVRKPYTGPTMQPTVPPGYRKPAPGGTQ